MRGKSRLRFHPGRQIVAGSYKKDAYGLDDLETYVVLNEEIGPMNPIADAVPSSNPVPTTDGQFQA